MFEEFDFSYEIYLQLKRGTVAQGTTPLGGVWFRFDPSVPWVATAMHAGHAAGDEMLKCFKLTEDERLYEEDPRTDDFIANLPSRMTGLDSRFEYDVNRPSRSTIGLKKEWAWGLEVFHTPPAADVELTCRRKYLEYYLALEAWTAWARERFGACIIYDIHSYNISRQVARGIADPPVFNVGTGDDTPESVAWRARWRPALDAWISALQSVEIPGVATTVEENKVFKGLGEQARFCRQMGDNVLCLPTEVSKVYMDEDRLEYYDDRVAALTRQLGLLIPQHAAKVLAQAKPMPRRTAGWLGPLQGVDEALFQARSLLDILKYVNPVNRPEELRRYLSDPGHYEPRFEYAVTEFSPEAFAASLRALPLERIEDEELARLYFAQRNECVELLDLIEARGSDRFQEISLAMFPLPSPEDIARAESVLERPFELDPRDIGAEAFRQRLQNKLLLESRRYYELAAYDVVFGPIASDAAFRAGRIEVRDGAFHSDIHVSNQECHEVYSHVFTWHNGLKQPLKIFRAGLPGSTMTQEGLGALCEFICGFFPPERIRVLAARWVAAQRLVSGETFARTTAELVERFKFDREEAFTIATRLWRGPGFTKDVIYAQGLDKVTRFWLDSGDLSLLFTGKVGLEWLPLVQRLLNEGKLVAPYCLPEFLGDADRLAICKRQLAAHISIFDATWPANQKK